jgi:hypothetical protein
LFAFESHRHVVVFRSIRLGAGARQR